MLRKLWILLITASVGCAAGCREDVAPTPTPAPDGAAADAPAGVIEFPAEVRAADDTVNDFVHKVLTTCQSGDYDAFRLLWSASEEPFPRTRYERAWKSFRRARVSKLIEMRTKTPDSTDLQPVYVVHATVDLDASVPEPERDIVLLIKRENEAWTLARPPQHLVRKILGHANDNGAESQPAADP